MNKKDAQKAIKKLRKEIEAHNQRYYIDAKPIITDIEYDSLMHSLIALEKEFPEFISPDSPSQRVGGAPLKEFKTIKHVVPMLSLDNTYSKEEVAEFDQRVKKYIARMDVEFFAEEKVDGVSFTLIYEQGVLVLAASRGDGKQGDDITENIKTISSIPLRIPAPGATFDGEIPRRLEVRAEAFLSHRNFERINKEKEKNGEEPFANPRNACAGTLKMLDPKLVASRRVDAFVHGLIQTGLPRRPHTQAEAHAYLKSLGFKALQCVQLCKNVEGVFNYIDAFEREKKELDHDVDGLVVKVNRFDFQNQLRSTSKAPRWAIAYKYPAERAETLLEEIKVQVGRTGVLTPVALLKPVKLSGTTVSRASLHNADEIARLDVRVGDSVLVEKSGEIIPKVVEVVKEKREGRLKKFSFPKKCPVCGGKIEKLEEQVAVRCINLACSAQLKARVRHFAQRTAMDIERLGSVWVDAFVDKGLIKDLADVYSLDFETVKNFERMGQKSTENLFKGIEESKSRTLGRLIFGLGIMDVGERGAQILAQKFRNLETLAKAGKEALESIREIGPVTAISIYDFFHQKGTKEILARLKKAGVRFDVVEEIKEDTPFSGKSFVITGSLEKYERKEAEALIRGLGGHPTGSVSKKTDYVIVGDSPGSKAKKAETLGIPILTEAEFISMLRKTE